MDIKALRLIVKESVLPGAGKGLFTEEFIMKDTCITEYRGTVSTWKNVNHNDGNNAYVFYVNSSHVVDACDHPQEPGRYINDAKGLQQARGLVNNARYVVYKKRIFIYATKNIPAGAEIFVSYGKEYWDTIKAYKKQDEAVSNLQMV
jgi:uncharacterized protein